MLIYPYRVGSRSVKALARATGSKIIKHHNSHLKGRARKTVLNWGASALPLEATKCRVINDHNFVRLASCKLLAFKVMFAHDVSIPEFTTDIEVARGWIEDGGVAICRKTTKGSGGAGIVVAEEVGTLINAPLYTLYVKKQSEWRVHVFNGKVILVQRKVRNNEVPAEEVDWRIRNHDRGFIFQRNDIYPPEQVIKQALDAIKALRLDFGAVDVIYNSLQEKAYVLEINCAPGLEGSTVQNYVDAIKEIL